MSREARIDELKRLRKKVDLKPFVKEFIKNRIKELKEERNVDKISTD